MTKIPELEELIKKKWDIHPQSAAADWYRELVDVIVNEVKKQIECENDG